MDDGTANFLATSPCSFQAHNSAMPLGLTVDSSVTVPVLLAKQPQHNTPQATPPQQQQQVGASVSGGPAVKKQIELVGGIGMIPHPEKADRGGEDAFFLTRTGMGVADGVGSWALQGIDAGLFARSLMIESRRGVEAGMRHPGKILERAHNATKMRRLKGSSTAVVLVLENDRLHSANLGDSGFMVIRQGEVYYRSKEQVHGFNTPYQIGHDAAGGDRPAAADVNTLSVQHGDIIVAGTDGLFDNLYQEHIVSMVNSAFRTTTTTTSTPTTTPPVPAVLSHIPSPGRGTTDTTPATTFTAEELTEKLQVLAEHIVGEAHVVAGRKTGRVPFGDAAAKYGMVWSGGKMDDITVCISMVCDLAHVPPSPPTPMSIDSNTSSTATPPTPATTTPVTIATATGEVSAKL